MAEPISNDSEELPIEPTPTTGRRDVLREIPIARIEQEMARVLTELGGGDIAFRVRVGSIRYHDWYHTDGMQMEVEISEVQTEEGDTDYDVDYTEPGDFRSDVMF